MPCVPRFLSTSLEREVLRVRRVAAVDAPSEGFADRVADTGGPADRRGPNDRNGPLDLTNAQAYALGVPTMEWRRGRRSSPSIRMNRSSCGSGPNWWIDSHLAHLSVFHGCPVFRGAAFFFGDSLTNMQNLTPIGSDHSGSLAFACHFVEMCAFIHALRRSSGDSRRDFFARS